MEKPQVSRRLAVELIIKSWEEILTEVVTNREIVKLFALALALAIDDS